MGQIRLLSLSYIFSPNQLYLTGNLSLQVGLVRPWPRHVTGGGCGDHGSDGGRHRHREGGGASSTSMWRRWVRIGGGGIEREGAAAMAGDREPVDGAHGGCGDRGASSGRQQAW